MGLQAGSLGLAKWYKNTIITICGRAKLLYDQPKEHSFRSNNLIIPTLLFIFTVSYIVGSFHYILYMLIGWFVGGCVSIPLILVFGENYNSGSSGADFEVHRSRLNLFRDMCIAWTNQDELYIVRFGLFIHSLINIFILSLISTLTQKSIEQTLYTFTTIGIQTPGKSNGEVTKETTGLPPKQKVFNKYWYHKNEKNLSVDESYELVEDWLFKDLELTEDKIKEVYNFNLSRESFPRLARNHMPY